MGPQNVSRIWYLVFRISRIFQHTRYYIQYTRYIFLALELLQREVRGLYKCFPSVLAKLPRKITLVNTFMFVYYFIMPNDPSVEKEEAEELVDTEKYKTEILELLAQIFGNADLFSEANSISKVDEILSSSAETQLVKAYEETPREEMSAFADRLVGELKQRKPFVSPIEFSNELSLVRLKFETIASLRSSLLVEGAQRTETIEELDSFLKSNAPELNEILTQQIGGVSPEDEIFQKEESAKNRFKNFDGMPEAFPVTANLLNIYARKRVQLAISLVGGATSLDGLNTILEKLPDYKSYLENKTSQYTIAYLRYGTDIYKLEEAVEEKKQELEIKLIEGCKSLADLEQLASKMRPKVLEFIKEVLQYEKLISYISPTLLPEGCNNNAYEKLCEKRKELLEAEIAKAPSLEELNKLLEQFASDLKRYAELSSTLSGNTEYGESQTKKLHTLNVLRQILEFKFGRDFQEIYFSLRERRGELILEGIENNDESIKLLEQRDPDLASLVSTYRNFYRSYVSSKTLGIGFSKEVDKRHFRILEEYGENAYRKLVEIFEIPPRGFEFS